MYEKLQDILNKCIEKWWKPRWSENIIRIEYRQYNDYNAEFRMVKNWSLWEVWYIVWTHDLLSKDSWLMEFVKRKEDNRTVVIFHFLEASLQSAEHVCYSWDYYYIIMWPMTAKEKMQYFINNIVI